MNMGAYTHLCPRLETCMRSESREVGCVPKANGNSLCFVAVPGQLGQIWLPNLFTACTNGP